MLGLVLRRASVSRPSGHWSRDDFDLHDGWQALRELATTRGLSVSALISSIASEREHGNLSMASLSHGERLLAGCVAPQHELGER
jgi:hypothetical protein